MDAGMAAFAILASALAALVLAIVLRPLWRERRMPTLVMAAVLALAALLLYRQLGTPAALDPTVREAPNSLEDAISKLRDRLKRDPGQVEGWRLLGRSYAAQGQPGEARDAFARAASLAPDDPDVLVEAAESSALAAPGHRFDDAAVARLRHALQVQPMHQRARWFLGLAQRQSGDAAGAASTWEPLLAQVDAATAASLRPEVDAARAEAGLPPLPQPAPGMAAPQAAALTVKVRLDPELAAARRLADTAAVFVIARAVGGPPMPVAVERHRLEDLPLVVTLDDDDSPMPTQPLSALRKVEVLARVSQNGTAIPQPGDLESAALEVDLPTDRPVELVIGKTRD